MRVALCCLVLASMSGVAAADEAAEYLKYYSWWEGSWNIEAKEGDEVTKFEVKITRQPGNCHLVVGSGTGLWGYDPKRKTWVGIIYSDDGSMNVTVMARHSGDKLGAGVVAHGTVTVKQVDGTVWKGENTWTYIDDNNVKQVSETTSPNGETMRTEFLAKRIK